MGRLTRCLSFICCIGLVNVWKLHISKKLRAAFSVECCRACPRKVKVLELSPKIKWFSMVIFNREDSWTDNVHIIPKSSCWCVYLDGLSKAAFSQHLSMDEVWGPEDPVHSTVGDDSQWLRAVNVLPLRERGRCVTGARRLINTVAPSGERGGEREREIKEGSERWREGKRERWNRRRKINHQSHRITDVHPYLPSQC